MQKSVPTFAADHLENAFFRERFNLFWNFMTTSAKVTLLLYFESDFILLPRVFKHQNFGCIYASLFSCNVTIFIIQSKMKSFLWVFRIQFNIYIPLAAAGLGLS